MRSLLCDCIAHFSNSLKSVLSSALNSIPFFSVIPNRFLFEVVACDYWWSEITSKMQSESLISHSSKHKVIIFLFYFLSSSLSLIQTGIYQQIIWSHFNEIVSIGFFHKTIRAHTSISESRWPKNDWQLRYLFHRPKQPAQQQKNKRRLKWLVSRNGGLRWRVIGSKYVNTRVPSVWWKSVWPDSPRSSPLPSQKLFDFTTSINWLVGGTFACYAWIFI